MSEEVTAAQIWRSSARAVGWRVELLSSSDVYIRDLSQDYVVGGSLEWNAFRAIIGSGELTLGVVPAADVVDWMSSRLRITYRMRPLGLGTIDIIDVPMGVWVPAKYSPTVTEFGASASVTLLDKLCVLEQDKATYVYSLAAGVTVTTAIEDIIIASGEVMFSVIPSAATLRVAKVWEAGTSWLTIINELLDAVGYSSLWVDALGVFRAEPYTPPDQRPLAWDFQGGTDSITAPEYAEDFDMHNIPNRYICVGTGTEDEDALVGVAENTDPTSPYSYQARGNRWITAVEDGVDAVSQDIINEQAARRLADSATPAVRMEVEHLIVGVDDGSGAFSPLQVDNAVINPNGQRATIAGMSVDLTPDALMNSSLRRFEGINW